MITEYHPSYAARARDLCMAGLNEVEIANVLGLSVGMLRAWRGHYVDFDQAWMDGTIHANVKVLGALHKRAIGYDYVKWRETKDGMMRELVHVEGSVPAQLAWLCNRMPDQWSNRGGADGGAPPPAVGDMSDLEAARSIAFALAKAVDNMSRGIEDGNATVPTKTK